MILAFETSTSICSVAYRDKNGKIWEKRIEGRSVHSDHVFLFTQELMQEHKFKIWDLSRVLVSNGPGSYTGLRIAASAIKGLVFGTDVDVYAINTLASFVIGLELPDQKTIHSIMDARRTHVYHQSFESGKVLKSTASTSLMEIEHLENILQPGDAIVGTGTARLNGHALKGVQLFDSKYISAVSLIKLYDLPGCEEFCIKTTSEQLNPNYISSNQVNNSNV